MARTLIHLPPAPRRGEIMKVQVTIAHPMETGHRNDDQGRLVPRNILTRFECHFDDQLVFAADLFPAISANAHIAFALRASASGTLRFTWEGDHGFRQTEVVALTVA